MNMVWDNAVHYIVDLIYCKSINVPMQSCTHVSESVFTRITVACKSFMTCCNIICLFGL